MFNSIFDSTTTGLSITTGLICAGVALLLGVIIAITHMAKDLLSVFFAMMVGLACGMGHVLFAVVITIISVVAIVFFTYTHFLEPNKKQRVLKIVVPEDLDYEEVFDEIFTKYTSRADLTQMKTMNMGSLYKLTYDITMKSGVKEKEFLDEIRVKNCNLKVLLSHPCMEEEI